MSDNSTNRKRTLVTLIVAFLLIGGGVFTFLVFQGLGDLKGDNKGAFSYGFAVRNVVLPLSNYFSPGDNDLGTARRTGEKLKVKGAEPSLLDGQSADVSDWMDKGEAGANAGAGAARASSAPPQPAGRTPVPKMGGGLGGVGGLGGGGSKTSGGASKFTSGADASDTSVTAAQSGKGSPKVRSGTLSALGSARASLSEGLTSGSAMTARAKWDQGFGLGTTGKKTGSLAYGKAGLVGLDRIKKGDIADLKMAGAQSLKTAEPKAGLDPAAEAKDPNLNKTMSDLAAASVKEAMIRAAAAAPQNNQKSGGYGKERMMPDPATIKLATNPPPEGVACGTGTKCAQERGYGDDKLSYQKNEAGNWVGIYEGTQDGVKYRDTVEFTPGQEQDWKLTGSAIQQSGGWAATCEPGGIAICQ